MTYLAPWLSDKLGILLCFTSFFCVASFNRASFVFSPSFVQLLQKFSTPYTCYCYYGLFFSLHDAHFLDRLNFNFNNNNRPTRLLLLVFLYFFFSGNVRNISPALWQFEHLTSLYLNDNCLMRLPPDIGLLVNLRTLDVSSNKLRSLPAELGELIQLR